VPGVQLFMQPAQDINVGGRLSRTLYQYHAAGRRQRRVEHLGATNAAAHADAPAMRDVATDQQIAVPTATITIDRSAAQRFGIETQQIDDTLYMTRSASARSRSISPSSARISSSSRCRRGSRGRPGDTAETLCGAPNGQAVPLSVLARTDTRPITPLAVNHQSQFPSVTISFNLGPNASLGDAVTAINKVRDDLRAPLSLQGSFQGSAQAFQSSLASEPYLIAAALTAVYIILGVLYESYILPLTILSTLPSAGVGALLMLMLAHTDLSVIAMIGIILLIGIVKKNGIMMVDFAIHAERSEGMAPTAAIRQACLLRFRPILMTTMAALLSGLPLMLESGAGAELRKPLGYAMVGGLMLSQILTLYTTPVNYLYLDRLQHFLAPRRRTRLPRLAEKLGEANAG
jgi:multidrug efflux pump subunit AcrB